MGATQRILIGAAAVVVLHAGPDAQDREKRATPPSDPTPLVFSVSFDNLPADQLQRPNGTPDPNWTTSEASVNLPGDGIYGAGNFVPEGGYGCPTGSSITTAASRSGAPGDRGFRFCMVYNPTINPNADGSN